MKRGKKRLGAQSSRICTPMVMKFTDAKNNTNNASFMGEPLTITISDKPNPAPGPVSNSSNESIEIIRYVSAGSCKRPRGKRKIHHYSRQNLNISDRNRTPKKASLKTITKKLKRRSITQLLKKERSFRGSPRRPVHRLRDITRTVNNPPPIGNNIFNPDAPPRINFSSVSTSQQNLFNFGRNSR